MNDTLKELAAMTKRFCEIYDDGDVGLCGIGWSLDGPYVQLNDIAFKQAFSSYDTNEEFSEFSRELSIMQDGVLFIALEQKQR